MTNSSLVVERNSVSKKQVDFLVLGEFRERPCPRVFNYARTRPKLCISVSLGSAFLSGRVEHRPFSRRSMDIPMRTKDRSFSITFRRLRTRVVSTGKPGKLVPADPSGLAWRRIRLE